MEAGRNEIGCSTRWAGSPCEESRLRRLLELGFRKLAIDGESRVYDFDLIQEFAPRGALAAISLFAPLPAWVRLEEAIGLRMGSLHPEERRDARLQGLRTLEAADRAEIPIVIVPPAPLDVPLEAEILKHLAAPAPAVLWEAFRKQRDASAANAKAFDSYLGTLAALLDSADRYALRLAIVPGGLPSESPDPAEIGRILMEFRGAPLCLWPDTLADARFRRTGGIGAGRLRGDLAPLVRGLSVEDGDTERGRMPLGRGEVTLSDWEDLRKAPLETSAQERPPEPQDEESREREESGEAGGERRQERLGLERRGQEMRRPVRIILPESTTPAVTVPAPPPVLVAPEPLRQPGSRPLPGRLWMIDIAPDVKEEDLLATREALARFLDPPRKEAFIPGLSAL